MSDYQFLFDQREKQLKLYKNINIYCGPLNYDDLSDEHKQCLKNKIKDISPEIFNSRSQFDRSFVICYANGFGGFSYKEILEKEESNAKTFHFPVSDLVCDIKVHNASYANFVINAFSIPMSKVEDVYTLEDCTMENPFISDYIGAWGRKPSIETDGDCVEITIINLIKRDLHKKLCVGPRFISKNRIFHELMVEKYHHE